MCVFKVQTSCSQMIENGVMWTIGTSSVPYTDFVTDKNTFSQTSWGASTQDYTGYFKETED